MTTHIGVKCRTRQRLSHMKVLIGQLVAIVVFYHLRTFQLGLGFVKHESRAVITPIERKAYVGG